MQLEGCGGGGGRGGGGWGSIRTVIKPQLSGHLAEAEDIRGDAATVEAADQQEDQRLTSQPHPAAGRLSKPQSDSQWRPEG